MNETELQALQHVALDARMWRSHVADSGCQLDDCETGPDNPAATLAEIELVESLAKPDTGDTAALNDLLNAFETKWAEYRRDGGYMGAVAAARADIHAHIAALVRANTARIAAQLQALVGNLAPGIADDAIYEAALAISRAGFEYAHELRACGHSIGDWRDADWDPSKSWDECEMSTCIGCEKEERAVQAERESCAKIAEDYLISHAQTRAGQQADRIAQCIVDDIRSRSTLTPPTDAETFCTLCGILMPVSYASGLCDDCEPSIDHA